MSQYEDTPRADGGRLESLGAFQRSTPEQIGVQLRKLKT
jgi:hypothetical protein